MAKPKKRSVVHLQGLATATARVHVQARITDSKYRVDLLKEDIHFKRVWLELPADEEGWMKLQYSADGPTGDPWPIGRLKVSIDTDELDENFGNFSDLTIEEA